MTIQKTTLDWLKSNLYHGLCCDRLSCENDELIPYIEESKMKNNEISLTLPLPPSINHYYGRTKTGRMYIGKRGKEFRLATKMALLQETDNEIEGAVDVIIQYIFKDFRKRDTDNLLKCTLDALTHAGAIEDDSMIINMHIVKRYLKQDEGNTLVYIAPAKCNIELRKSGAWIV